MRIFKRKVQDEEDRKNIFLNEVCSRYFTAKEEEEKIGRNYLECLSSRPKHGNNLIWSRNFMTRK